MAIPREPFSTYGIIPRQERIDIGRDLGCRALHGSSNYHVSQVRMLILAMANVANSEKSIAASRPLHNAPDP